MRWLGALWAWIKWRAFLAGCAFAKFSAAKGDPVMITTLAVISAAAAPSSVLDNKALLFWLFVGSCCGACFVLFGDERKKLTWRSVANKLSVCFVPGFCLTGAGIKFSGFEMSPETVLALSLLVSVGGAGIVAKLVKKTEDKIEGGGP